MTPRTGRQAGRHLGESNGGVVWVEIRWRASWHAWHGVREEESECIWTGRTIESRPVTDSFPGRYQPRRHHRRPPVGRGPSLMPLRMVTCKARDTTGLRASSIKYPQHVCVCVCSFSHSCDSGEEGEGVGEGGLAKGLESEPRTGGRAKRMSFSHPSHPHTHPHTHPHGHAHTLATRQTIQSTRAHRAA